MAAQILSRGQKIFLTPSISLCSSTMLELEWFYLEKVSYNGQRSFFLKDVGIVKDLREKWASAFEKLAQRYTVG